MEPHTTKHSCHVDTHRNDNTRTKAAIKERQILLNTDPDHPSFKEDTPHKEMESIIQKVLTNLQEPSGPAIMIKALESQKWRDHSQIGLVRGSRLGERPNQKTDTDRKSRRQYMSEGQNTTYWFPSSWFPHKWKTRPSYEAWNKPTVSQTTPSSN